MSTPRPKDPREGMTSEMKAAYDDFYGNEERLKKEWRLCTQQYETALALSEVEVAFATRMAFRRLSDYWKNRRNALQGALDERLLSLVTEKEN